MLNNFDLFIEFYNNVKKSENIKDILRQYGGGNIYIPSYKGTYRNTEIIEKYDDGIKMGKNSAILIRQIAAEYELSYNTVLNITREVRD